MFYACVQRFDVTSTVQNFLGLFDNLNKALVAKRIFASWYFFKKYIFCTKMKAEIDESPNKEIDHHQEAANECNNKSRKS
jgi:hypothetical protein